jgi:hypothetical protein
VDLSNIVNGVADIGALLGLREYDVRLGRVAATTWRSGIHLFVNAVQEMKHAGRWLVVVHAGSEAIFEGGRVGTGDVLIGAR